MVGGRNVMVGVMEHLVYETERLILKAGDALFMYTDGVTEAMNETEELFSGERLEEELVGLEEKSIQEMIAHIKEKITSFAHGAPQSDDITMMIIQFNGNQSGFKE
jgi:sigma-B regulation protein RsbU (phosphoserine phosphatase)